MGKIKTVADSLANFWTCSLYSFSCCYCIAYLAAKEGEVSIFHCEEVASCSLEKKEKIQTKRKSDEQIIPWRIWNAHFILMGWNRCTTDYDLIKCYSSANDFVCGGGKMYNSASQMQ